LLQHVEHHACCCFGPCACIIIIRSPIQAIASAPSAPRVPVCQI
jgi:hypothetical protein